MRRVLSLAAVAVAALGVAAVVDSTSAGAVRRGHPPTQITVVRPVNAAGFPQGDYTVHAEPTGLVDCSFPNPSPAAVSRNIEFCSPNAEYAVACWKAAVVHKVLCLRNPRAHKLVRIPRDGPFAPTGLAPADERAPLSMALASGDYCVFRAGGTAPTRAGHPQWIATYYCNSGKIVWMRPGARHYGVNETSDSWVVTVAGPTGPIFVHHLSRAWFVGTAPSG
jgi:hypothetical protein